MNIEEDLGKLKINSIIYTTRLSTKFLKRQPYKPADPRLVMSFIPGTVLEILVKEGESVSAGDDLLILDAMKMQNRLKCPIDGTIKSVVAKKGDRVSKGVLLIELE